MAWKVKKLVLLLIEEAMIPSVTKERYEKMIQNCADANMNMLRVWGGGIYEDGIFYDLCDKYGLLVYQDFMFASQMPPADSAYLTKVEKEAIYQVKRLRNHACMALWAGGNETESAWFEGFMPKEYPMEVYNVDHKKLFDTLLPTVVHKYHPDISYVRSSPTTGTDSIRVNTPGYGDTHAWSVWFGKIDFDQAKYNRLSRFISEYGFVGYPAYTSMKKYIPAEHMDTSSGVFQFRDDNMLLATNLHYFKRCKDLNLPETKIEYKLITKENKTFIEIKSRKLAKNIYLIDDRGKIHFSNNYFDLLPGESVRIGFNSDISMKKLNERFNILTLNDVMEQKH